MPRYNILYEFEAVHRRTGMHRVYRVSRTDYARAADDLSYEGYVTRDLKLTSGITGNTDVIAGHREVTAGELRLNNPVGVDGRRRFRELEEEFVSAGHPFRMILSLDGVHRILLNGVVTQVRVGKQVSIGISTTPPGLNQPVPLAHYEAADIGPTFATVEAGVPIPRLLGEVAGIAPHRLGIVTWRVAASLSAVLSVTDQGQALTFDSDRGTAGDFDTYTPPAGHYATDLATGRIKTGLEPVGQFLVSARGEAFLDDSSTAYTPVSHGAMLKALLAEVLGWNLVDAATFDQMDITDPHPAGLLITEAIPYAEIVGQLVLSSGAIAGPDARGIYCGRYFQGMAGTPIAPDAIVTEVNQDQRIQPRYGADVTYGNGAVHEARVIDEAAIQALYPGALVEAIETQYATEAGAIARGDRFLSHYAGESSIYKFTVDAGPDQFRIGDRLLMDGRDVHLVRMQLDWRQPNQGTPWQQTLYGWRSHD